MLQLHTSGTGLSDVIRVRAAISLSAAQVGIFDCDWERPMQGTARLRNHNIFMSLTPPPRGAQISRDWLDGRYADVNGAGLFPAGEQVRARSEGGPERILLCRIAPERFDELIGHSVTWDAATRLAAMDLRDTAIRNTLMRIARELLEPGIASGVLVEALFTTLIVDIGRYLDGRRQAQLHTAGTLASWQLRRIDEYAQQLAGPTPTLAEVAVLCRISVRQLVRAFKASTGKTVQQYFALRQIELAKTLLADSDEPLKALAIRLGFRQAGSFTTAFLRSCGETPSAYRRRTRH